MLFCCVAWSLSSSPAGLWNLQPVVCRFCRCLFQETSHYVTGLGQRHLGKESPAYVAPNQTMDSLHLLVGE